MKMPRDVSGYHLAKLLEKYGYSVTRQTGSHIRLTTLRNEEHHITIPVHHELRVGTLNAILTDIAVHLKLDRDQLTKELFEK